MSGQIDRRDFLGTAAGGVAASMVMSQRAAAAPSNRILVGVMGLNRGRSLMETFAGQPGVEIKYVCDVDKNRMTSAAKLMEGKGKQTTPTQDYRRILDDKDVDVLVCAAPNHWHGPATILACAAGKHVYVEKPCCHNPQEGEWMIAAARKYKRAVQMGSQRRSGPTTIEAIEKLHNGVIGRVYLSRSWYNNLRGEVPIVDPSDPPAYLDYELWQGPAPRRPFRTNVVPYNWHWNWHWGNGELGNNGIHTLDLSRWGLDVDYPIRATSSGGRYQYDDAQQTPDTHTVCFEFEGEKQIVWEGLSCNKHRIGFVCFYGTEGSMNLDGNGTHQIFDRNDKLISETKAGSRGDVEHVANLLAAIRNDDPLNLNAEIEKGHKSTLLCHLGNIAHRTGHTVNCNPENGHILNDADASKLWRREYEPGWEPKV